MIGTSVRELLGDQAEQLLGRPGALDGDAEARQARAGEMHVRIDEAGEDDRAGKLDEAVRGRRVADADALDVTLVDEEPVPGLRVAERVDAPCPVERLHARSIGRLVPEKEGES